MTFNDLEALQRVTIIVQRKSDYLTAFMQSAGAGARTPLSTEEKRALKQSTTQAIVALPISLFVSDAESATHRLNPRTPLEDLNRDGIWEELRKRLPDISSS
jgi:hypothetical protein